ncbi:MAG: hypothetical protein KAJ57_02100 [Woeseiaceae bacterium]|nr:hypothetical protein [Woeseiaceae bacterium]
MNLPTDRIEASLLRRALLVNATFSGICGLLVIVFDARIVALITDVEHHLWPLGAMLVAFSASLLWFATRRTISSTWVTSVIIADLAWVVGTIALLVGWRDMMSVAGVWILAIIGVLVLLFAELQWFGLRRLRKAAG